MDVNYITFDEVVELHEDVIEESGGSKGTLYEPNLEFLIRSLRNDFEMKDREDLFEAAAMILENIITKHPFIDGNKRTGFVAADVFLSDNGYDLRVDVKDGLEFCISVAKNEKSFDEIKTWLMKHTEEKT